MKLFGSSRSEKLFKRSMSCNIINSCLFLETDGADQSWRARVMIKINEINWKHNYRLEFLDLMGIRTPVYPRISEIKFSIDVNKNCGTNFV